MAGRLCIAVALLTAACSSKTVVNDGGSTGGSCAIASCSGTDNTTCPSQTNYTCQNDCCVFFCQQISDCASQPCAKSALGCVCDLGECQQKVCSTDQDCGTGLVCVGGTCEAPVASAASCTITPELFVTHAGAGTQLSVAAFDADGGVVRSGAAPTFTVSDGVGQVDATETFTDAHASTNPGDVSITATVAGVSCTAQATVYAAATSPQVTVIDGNTALPVTDATIVISAAANGTILGTPVVGGDVLGRYPISAQTLGVGGMVTVFEEKYEFASAIAPGFADGGTFGMIPDLVFVLAQTGSFDTATNAPYTGGYVGDFSKGVGPFSTVSSNTSSVLLGIAGTAVPEDPGSLSLAALLGPSVNAMLGSVAQPIPLPVGVEVNFSGEPLDCRYEGLGPAGGCGLAALDGGVDPFTCAKRPAWGIGGPIPTTAVEGLFVPNAPAPTLSEILAVAGPAFPSFSSGVGFEVPYTLAPQVLSSAVPNSCTGAAGTGTTPIPNPNALAPFQLQLDTPVDLVAQVTLPAMPQLSGTCVQLALVLGGVISPQVGMLPLGLSAASTLNAASMPSASCLTYDPLNPTQADGQIGLHLAPAHGGLEGLPYGVLALSGLGASDGAVSGLIQVFTDLPYDTPVGFGGQPFLGFTQGTTYTAAARTFALGAGLATPPTLYRLRFTESAGAATGPDGQWAIQIPPGSGSVVLPVPPSPFEDRTAMNSAVNIEALQLQPSATETALVDFSNGAAEFNLLQELQAFSSVGVTVQ